MKTILELSDFKENMCFVEFYKDTKNYKNTWTKISKLNTDYGVYWYNLYRTVNTGRFTGNQTAWLLGSQEFWEVTFFPEETVLQHLNEIGFVTLNYFEKNR